MKRLLYVFALGLLLLGSANQVSADLAPPPKPKPTPPIKLSAITVLTMTNLEIVTDKNSYNARLQISKETLRNMQAALEAAPGDQSNAQHFSGTSSNTIMSGVFLFLSLSFGGVLLARSGQSRSQRVMAAMMIGAAVIGAAAIITRANGAPPAYRWRNLSQNLTAGRTTQGGVTIEVMPEGDGVKLILPQISPTNSKAGEE